ncbi:hypothetical protein vseg_020319 [Gypsophila vaccaria]
MASSTILRRLAGNNNIISANMFRPLRAVSATRLFNTNAQMTRVDDDEHDDRSDRTVSRRGRDRDFPGFFSDVFDPFTPTRSVSQLMSLMDQLMDSPYIPSTRGGARRGWDIREDDDALHLKVDMPGLGKEHVKVSVEENTLIIKGEGERETEDEEESRRRYSSRIDLTPNVYKVDGIKAEMKNGVLKVVVPKVKEEERKDVFQVNVD